MSFEQSVQAVDSLEAAEAMASAAKRIRVEEPKSFRALDVDAMTLKVVDGREEKYCIPLLDNDPVRFLLTPEAPAVVTWGFDMAGVQEQRSFNSSKPAPKSGSESLSIRIQLDEEQAAFLSRIDERMMASSPHKDAVWNPLVSKQDRFDRTTVKASVCLKGDDANLTLIKVKRGDGPVQTGRGWDFLKTVAGDEFRTVFTNAEVKVVAKLRFYTIVDEKDMGKRTGLSLTATQLFFKPKPLEREVIQEADILNDW